KKAADHLWSKIPKKLRTVASLVIIAVPICIMFLIPHKEPINNTTDSRCSITTQNQSGGTNTTNCALPPRTLDEAGEAGLDAILSPHKGSKVGISYLMGDYEAQQFASQTYEYLKSRGWNLYPSISAQLSPDAPAKAAVYFDKKTNEWSIYVGQNL